MTHACRVTLLVVLAGCGSRPVVIPLDLVDASGQNPAADIAEGEVHWRVLRMDDGPIVPMQPGEIRDGVFAESLPSFDLAQTARLEVRLDGRTTSGESVTRHGAFPPLFLAGLAGGCPRLAVVPSGACVPVDVGDSPCLCEVDEDGNRDCAPGLGLPRPVSSLAVVPWQQTSLLAFGGREVDGDVEAPLLLERVDLIGAELRASRVSGPLGPARGISLADDVAVIVGDGPDLRVFTPGTDGLTPTESATLTAHAGAGAASALLAYPSGLAAVIGGVGSDVVTWLEVRDDESGLRVETVATTRLATARERPAAVALAEGILVVGGAASDAPSAEWLPRRGDGQALTTDLPALAGGVLAPDLTDDGALYLGAEGADGVDDATWVVEGCPACAARPGPTWDAPRAAPAATTTAGVTWVVGGRVDGAPSNAVDRIVWDAAGPTIVPLAGGLSAARADATVVEHAPGMVLVVGGDAADDAVSRRAELCSPETLFTP